jgi:type IV secretory pathway VirB10-like protein
MHDGHYSRYMGGNIPDAIPNPPHRTPLLPIQSDNVPFDPYPPPPPSQAPGTRHPPTSKAGGSRRKRAASPLAKKSNAKGKRRRVDSDLDEPSEAMTDSEDERPAAATAGHGGRRAGAGNYKDADLTKLLDLTQKELPVGQRGWQKIHKEYETWAKANSRPIRDARSLELKFKSVCSW